MKEMLPHERIIVALDVSNVDLATQLAKDLLPHVGLFKVGFEAIYSTMANLLLAPSGDDLYPLLKGVWEFCRAIQSKVFLDVKLCDIPNTVGKASKAIARLQPAIFNLHASCGKKAIVEAVANKGNSHLFGVTVLTSIEQEECCHIFGASPDAQLLRLSEMLVDAGADGIICAPKEGQMLRQHPKFDALTIATPNVRPSWAAGKDDQAKDRQMTPFQAIASGIDMLIIGRPITNPSVEIGGPVNAAKEIAKEITAGLACRMS